jgi:hypothetical protein
MPTMAGIKLRPRTLTCSLPKHTQQSSMNILMPASRHRLRQLSHHFASFTTKYPTPARTLLAAGNRQPVPMVQPGQLLPPTAAPLTPLAQSVDQSHKVRVLIAASRDRTAVRASFGVPTASVLLLTAHRRKSTKRG